MLSRILSLSLLLSVFWGSSVSAQELFIVHPHEYYLEENFDNPRSNRFVDALTRISEAFCERKLRTYWVYDSDDHWFNRRFPIRRCGSQKLRSPWGDLTGKSFELDRTVVFTGLMLNQCVSRAFRSVVERFVGVRDQDEINLHFPMPALIAWANQYDYPTDEIRNSILASDSMFIVPYGASDEAMRRAPYHLEISINGKFEKSVQGRSTATKKVRMHFWSKTEDMLSAIGL